MKNLIKHRTAEGHYLEAERWIAIAREHSSNKRDPMPALALAQVHATLATVAPPKHVGAGIESFPVYPGLLANYGQDPDEWEVDDGPQ